MRVEFELLVSYLGLGLKIIIVDVKERDRCGPTQYGFAQFRRHLKPYTQHV